MQKNKSRVCEILGINRSSVYYKKKTRTDEIEELIVKIFKKHNANYGCPRIKEELRKLGHTASKRRIGRILKKFGMEAKHGRRKLAKNIHTCTKEKYISENLIKKIKAERTNDIWQTDFTEIKYNGGKIYISGIIDVYDKTVLSLHACTKANYKSIEQSFSQAIEKYGSPKIIHSDRGGVYVSKDFKTLLEQNKIYQSMSKPASPNENQYIETFWKTMKVEIGQTKNFTKTQLIMVIEYYLNYYNQERIHSSINYKTPTEKRLAS